MNINKDMKGWYCYSYQRISSVKQKKGGGIGRQLELSKKYCDERGWVLDTTFKLTDIGKSAFHSKNLDDNAALGQFLKASKDGFIHKPCILLVESLDRLSRSNVVDALELFLGIIKSGITICTYADNAIYNRADIQNNFTPLMASIIYMARSHDESMMKSKRIKADWAKRRAGKKNNGLVHENVI